MRRRLILAAAVLVGSTAAFVIPQAAQAQAQVCVLQAHVALGSTNVIGPTTVCL